MDASNIFKIIFQVVLLDSENNAYNFTNNIWLSLNLGLSVVIDRGK